MKVKEQIRKELRLNEFKYRLYRISYFGMVGAMSLLMLVFALYYFDKLYWMNVLKSFLVLSPIIIVCGLYFITYYSRLDKWYNEYQKKRMEDKMRNDFWQDVENGKHPNFKIVRENEHS